MGVYITARDEKREWNNFVSQSNGSIFHLWEWGEVIEECLKQRKTFFVSRGKNGKINGILPLFFKSILCKNKLISLPCTGFVDVLAKNPEVKKALLEAAFRFATETEAQLKIYNSEKLKQLPEPFCQKESMLSNYLLRTDGTYQDIFDNKLGRSKRREIREIKKVGIEIKKANRNDLGQFYKMHLRMMKKLGVLPLPKLAFELIIDNFEKYSLFMKSIVEGETKAYMWNFIYGEKIYLWRIAYQRGSSKDNLYYQALIEESIKIACNDKYIRLADFGCAVPGGGHAYVKERWSSSPLQIYLISQCGSKEKEEFSKHKVRESVLQRSPPFIFDILATYFPNLF